MSVTLSSMALIATPGQQFALSDLISVSSGNNPEYLVMTGFERLEYPTGDNAAQATLSGNGNTAKFAGASAQTSSLGADYASLGVVFTYTAQGYYNSTYGYLDSMTVTASSGNNHGTYLSLYGFGTAGQADDAQLQSLQTIVANYGQAIAPAFYSSSVAGQTSLGSLDLVTQTGAAGPAPSAATPSAVAAIAKSFVGQVWSDNGCWVLGSDIAALAGASLSVSSTVAVEFLPPQANGEWAVVYDSVGAGAQQQATWQSQLRTGDIVMFATPCGGHVATVASGSGYGAQVIENGGASANDGSPNDIVIAAPHPFIDELDNLYNNEQIVIYRLDTPVVTQVLPLAAASNSSVAIAPAISTTDPTNKAIQSYQVYDATGAGSFSVNGAAATAASASQALTVTQADIGSLTYLTGSGTGSDTIEIRAFNGSYWGDWQAVTVQLGATSAAPILASGSALPEVRNGAEVALTSLVATQSSGSAVSYYTIHISPQGTYGGGQIDLNGAVDQLANSAASDGGKTYQVSAADFAKVHYLGGGYLNNGMDLTITATNASGQTSNALDVPIWNYGLTMDAVTHYLAPGTVIHLTDLYSLSGIDSNFPIAEYTFNLYTASTNKINLNGAVNLRPVDQQTYNGASEYDIAPTDIGKVTVTVGTDVNQDQYSVINIGAIDSANSTGTNNPRLVAATAPQIFAPQSTEVGIGVSVSFLKLMGSDQSPANLIVHIYDPVGGGVITLNGAQNLLYSSLSTNEYEIRGSDLTKVTYTGGTGSEELLISGSTDGGTTWSPEVALTATGVTTAQNAALIQQKSAEAPVAVTDSAVDIVHDLDALQSVAAGGRISSMSLTDSGIPNLSITAEQLSADKAALSDISGSYTLTISAGDSAVTIAGPSGHGTTVQYSGDASQYSVAAANGGLTVTGAGGTDHLSSITALEFADFTEIVAAAPGTGGTVTTGNVAELYSAVLARTPDVPGLSFYQSAITANAGLTMIQLSEYFLRSSEYTGNTAHNYAQSAVGDEQFIGDSYQNLLHRTPTTSEVSFYETNVLAPAVANLVPGTTAYANAQLQAHALMLVYFANSTEFVGEVQVTAAHPADAAHWLVLI